MSRQAHLELEDRPHFRFVVECNSSNDLALDWIRQGAPDGALVLCDRQSAGRGRGGRVWHSPPACNLYLSRVVRGPEKLLPLLTLAGALAVRETADLFLPPPKTARIKWPNDVWVDGAKIAGILAERGPNPAPGTAACALGVGLNVNIPARALPSDLRSPASSLRELNGHEQDRQNILQNLVANLDRWVELWRQEPDRIAPAVAAHCLTLGRRVKVTEPGRPPWKGLARSLEADGRLLIRDEKGRWRRLDAGYVDPCESCTDSTLS